MIKVVIGRYFRLYQMFVSTCFSEATSYRVHFVLMIILDVIFYLTSLLTVVFLYDHVNMIGGWNRDQFLFFVAVTLMIDQLHMCFVSMNFWMLSDHIRTGSLDFILLRPPSVIFTAYFRYIRPATLVNFVVVLPILIFFGLNVGLVWWQWMMLPFLILIGLSVLVCLEMVFSVSMFWLVEGLGVNFLRMQFQSISRWPDFIYQGVVRRIFTVFFPLILVVNGPVRFLFDRSDGSFLAGCLIVIFVCVFLIRYLWKMALVRYDSASS